MRIAITTKSTLGGENVEACGHPKEDPCVCELCGHVHTAYGRRGRLGVDHRNELPGQHPGSDRACSVFPCRTRNTYTPEPAAITKRRRPYGSEIRERSAGNTRGSGAGAHGANLDLCRSGGAHSTGSIERSRSLHVSRLRRSALWLRALRVCRQCRRCSGVSGCWPSGSSGSVIRY
jgi:hypothetical protein